MEHPARSDADNCFVCGKDNPIGLKIPFTLAQGICRGEFTAQKDHVGFDGVAHGGIIFSVLDDLMANWLFLQGGRGYTAKCEIRYRQPLAVGETVNVSCELLKRKGRLLQLAAKAELSDSKIVAEAEASFMIEDFGRIDDQS